MSGTDEPAPQAAEEPKPQTPSPSISQSPTPSSSVAEPAKRSSKVTIGDSTHSAASSVRGRSLKKRRSSLFASARASFYRSRGQSGASVETLRGTTGASFEGYANVHRGSSDGLMEMSSLLCCLGGSNKDKLYFLLIKGYHCFVFKDEEGKSPKYAIELINRRAVIQPSHSGYTPRVPHPGAPSDTTYTTIHLETGLGDVEYKFTFANSKSDGKASAFAAAVANASSEATTEQVRKRLGHEGLLNKRSSVRYANTIGAAKAKEQPDAPMGVGEALAGMPTTETYA